VQEPDPFRASVSRVGASRRSSAGALAGTTLAGKDNIERHGLPFTAALPLLDDSVGQRDAIHGSLAARARAGDDGANLRSKGEPRDNAD
jgi:Asp-tRNA(Asn)/Glu-tRNA(Gln) amidotransferase A subunit family amidase